MRPSLRSIIPSWIFSQVVTAESSWCFDPCFFGSTTDAAYKSSCLLSASRSSLSFPSQSSARSGGCIVLDDQSTRAMILLPSFEESSSWMTFFGSLYLYAFLMPRYSPSTGFSSAKKSYFQWSVIIRDAVAHSRRVRFDAKDQVKMTQWRWMEGGNFIGSSHSNPKQLLRLYRFVIFNWHLFVYFRLFRPSIATIYAH